MSIWTPNGKMPTPAHWVECADCDGHGEHIVGGYDPQDDHAVPCDTCHGIGYIDPEAGK